MTYAIHPILDPLCQAFPSCFSRTAPKPLKIGPGKAWLALAFRHPTIIQTMKPRTPPAPPPPATAAATPGDLLLPALCAGLGQGPGDVLASPPARRRDRVAATPPLGGIPQRSHRVGAGRAGTAPRTTNSCERTGPRDKGAPDARILARAPSATLSWFEHRA